MGRTTNKQVKGISNLISLKGSSQFNGRNITHQLPISKNENHVFKPHDVPGKNAPRKANGHKRSPPEKKSKAR
jgi:hypothetical protein